MSDNSNELEALKKALDQVSAKKDELLVARTNVFCALRALTVARQAQPNADGMQESQDVVTQVMMTQKAANTLDYALQQVEMVQNSLIRLQNALDGSEPLEMQKRVREELELLNTEVLSAKEDWEKANQALNLPERLALTLKVQTAERLKLQANRLKLEANRQEAKRQEAKRLEAEEREARCREAEGSGERISTQEDWRQRAKKWKEEAEKLKAERLKAERPEAEALRKQSTCCGGCCS
jgi:hypothetical protein